MDDVENYKGYLLASHPKRSDQILRKSVVLIIDQDHSGSVGLQLNKPLESSTNFAGVMNNLGITYSGEDPVYFGGPENTNRIIVVHSTDWMSNNSTEISEDIAISNDVSVLAAIAEKKGPKKFRAVAGFTRWMPGQLEGEIDCDPPWNDVTSGWSIIKATSRLAFSNVGVDQWHTIIKESARQQISSWF